MPIVLSALTDRTRIRHRSDVNEAENDRQRDGETARSLTDAAFASFRASRKEREPNLGVMKNDDELHPMAPEDLSVWKDGRGVETDDMPASLGDAWIGKEELWVVRAADVVHAAKKCVFGVARKRGEITHTNLTGGGRAYVGGELVVLDENTVVINGDSGRYGTKDDAETEAVARAFAESGWTTFWVGWDEDLARPAPLFGTPLRRAA